ncbi:MAG: OmpA family protein [Hyphomicrobiaceae bacterium]|nr:OmpA family protein [Hyphomicrobiaceae bacterium]
MRCNPWRWLWGIIPIAILSFLTVQWEHERIEADLTSRARTALQSAGLTWAATAFDGRDGLITGQANIDDAPQRALNVVRNVWGVRVSDQRTRLLQRIEPYVWSAGLRGNRLKLTGYVPGDTVRTTIVGMAKAAFPHQSIDDRLEPARGVPDENTWLGGIGFSMKQLAALGSGSVSLRDTGLTIEGQAGDLLAYKSVKGALKHEMPQGIRLAAEKIEPPTISPYTWTVRRKGNQIQLEGYVPDDSLREQIFAHAKKMFPRLAIVDRMEKGSGAPDGLAAVARSALDQLARLDQGEVRVVDRKVNISGRAPDKATANSAGAAMRQAARGMDVTQSITFPEPKPEPVTPYVIKIEKDGTAITLSGYVPSEEAHAKLLAAVRKSFPERDIRDQLQLASGEPPGWFGCLSAGIAGLKALDSASFTVTDATSQLVGRTRDEAVAGKVPGDLRTAANRACETTANVSYDAPPEPDLNWRATYDGAQIVTLEGDVIDARTRAALVQAATQYFPDAQIQDRMTIKSAVSQKWPVAADLGLKLIALLRKGEAVLSAQELVVQGEARDTAVQTGVREQLVRATPKGYKWRENVKVRSDAMIWAEQEAKRQADEKAARERAAAEAETKRKSEEVATAKVETQKRKQEADVCRTKLRDIATTGTIQFDWASANLDRASKPTLDKLADVARACPKARIEIEGHTDAEGTPDRNKSLSERRAKAVYDYLSKAGVGAERLSAVGYGETRPVAPNDTPANRAKNRRIEFSVSP